MKFTKLLPWLITFALSWSFGFAYNVYHGGIIGWIRKTHQNKVILAQEIETKPRLMLVGGSGMHYTVNSDYLTEKLGIEVFNMGLDGKLGLDVIFSTVLPEIRQGDIVLVIPEYLMLLDQDGIGDISVHFAVATNQPNIIDVKPKKFIEDTWMLGITGLKSLVKSGVDLSTKGKFDEYYSDPLTKRGEPTKTWERNSKWWQLTVDDTITQHSIDKIKEFQQQLNEKGATMVLSLPVIYGSTEENSLSNIQKTAQELEAIAPLIYDQDNLNVWTDVSLFAETHYHLNPEGRIKRSQDIIEQLEPILKPILAQVNQ